MVGASTDSPPLPAPWRTKNPEFAEHLTGSPRCESTAAPAGLEAAYAITTNGDGLRGGPLSSLMLARPVQLYLPKCNDELGVSMSKVFRTNGTEFLSSRGANKGHICKTI